VLVNGFPRALPFGLSLFMQRLQNTQLRSLNKNLLITTSDYIDAFLVVQEIAKKLNMEFFYIDISVAPCDKEIFKETFARLKERSENSKKRVLVFFQSADLLVNKNIRSQKTKDINFREILDAYKNEPNFCLIVHREKKEEFDSDVRYYFDYEVDLLLPDYSQRKELFALRFKDANLVIDNGLLRRIAKSTENWSWQRLEFFADQLVCHAKKNKHLCITEKLARDCFNPDYLINPTGEIIEGIKDACVIAGYFLAHHKIACSMLLLAIYVGPLIDREIKKKRKKIIQADLEVITTINSRG
jgi:hypothetical protein